MSIRVDHTSPRWNDEEVVAVILHEYDGKWRPHSIFTRSRYEDRWLSRMYDANYSKADDTTYVHESGGGPRGNEVYLHGFVEAKSMPGQIWLHTDACLVRGDLKRTPIPRRSLRRMGYRLLDACPDDAFSDATDGDAHWCEACQDNIGDDDTFTCGRCGMHGHEHGVGQMFVVMNEEEAEMKVGLYRVVKLPYRYGTMFHEYLNDGSIEWIGPIPLRMSPDDPGFPCELLCDECRDIVVADLKTGAATAMTSDHCGTVIAVADETRKPPKAR